MIVTIGTANVRRRDRARNQIPLLGRRPIELSGILIKVRHFERLRLLVIWLAVARLYERAMLQNVVIK